ncbi:MAG: NADH-quinone oxidoreductase subunit H, partial [Candidatus Hodarchaeales archaeon]
MSIITTLTDFIISFLGFLDIHSREEGLGVHFAGVLDVLIIAVILLVIIALDLMFFVVWLERKLISRMMTRRGPTHVGPYGLFQNLADFTKLLGKELITPKKADKFGFYFALSLMVVTAAMSIFLIPWSNNFVITAPNAGMLLIFSIFSIYPIAVLVAGWAS